MSLENKIYLYTEMKPVTKDTGCDSVLLGQDCRTPRGAVTVGIANLEVLLLNEFSVRK
jgi:hypothetical protein